jgi:hypothetical protein
LHHQTHNDENHKRHKKGDSHARPVIVALQRFIGYAMRQMAVGRGGHREYGEAHQSAGKGAKKVQVVEKTSHQTKTTIT